MTTQYITKYKHDSDLNYTRQILFLIFLNHVNLQIQLFLWYIINIRYEGKLSIRINLKFEFNRQILIVA